MNASTSVKTILWKRFILVGLVVISVVATMALLSKLSQHENRVERYKRQIIVTNCYASSDEFGDGITLIRGKINTRPVAELAQILGLIEQTSRPVEEIIPGGPGWQLFQKLDWWDLPTQFDITYYRHRSGYLCLLGKKDDELFLQVIEW